MSESVLQHGRFKSALCTACGTRQDHHGDLGDRPACTNCGERALRPDIVWFGEAVREGERIQEAIKNCEVFAVIGSSGTVHTAAGFARLAADHDAQTVLIDLDPDAHENIFCLVYEGLASESVPHWMRDVMLRHGGIGSGNDGSQDLSGELEQLI